jgi:hypothetical protein
MSTNTTEDSNEKRGAHRVMVGDVTQRDFLHGVAHTDTAIDQAYRAEGELVE